MKKIIYPSIFLLWLNFVACQNNTTHSTTKTTSELTSTMADSAAREQANADQLIARTFDTLRNALQSSMAKSGATGAIDFCQVNAYPITSSYANNDTLIRRAALRFRNPANQPDTLENRILLEFQSSLAEGKNLAPKLIRRADSIHYFKPIQLQAMCITCHGDPTSAIAAATLAAIQSKYPDDRAVGFKENELRGMWHIKWLRK